MMYMLPLKLPFERNQLLKTCPNRSNSEFRTFVKRSIFSLALLGALFASPAHALNTIALDPNFLTVSVGDTFQLDLLMNFTDQTVGGGVEIRYDSNFEFVAFQFDPAFLQVANFGLGSPAVGETAQPLEVAFGYFNFVNPTQGLSGSYTIGTFTFNAINEGAGKFVLTDPSPLSPGPFYSPTDSVNPLVVSFGDTQIEILPAGATVIPEPTSAILMGLGLAGLGFFPGPRPNR